VTIYIQPCVLRRGRAQRDETQSGTEERECCAGEVGVLVGRETGVNGEEGVGGGGGGWVGGGFFFFFFGVSWMRNGKSGRLVDVCNRVFEVLVTLR